MHNQADLALDAFLVQMSEQKKSQKKSQVTMIAPCHEFWSAEDYHQQLIGKMIGKTEVAQGYRVFERPVSCLFCLHIPDVTCKATDGCL